MVLTAAQCLGHIKHTLGTGPEGTAMSPGMDGYSIINQAGEHLVNAREWRYLQGASTTMSLTDAQAYLTLPSDFRAPIGVESTNGYTANFEFTTLKDFLEFKSRPVQDTGSWYKGVIVSVQSATTGAPALRIDIYPVPSGGEVGTGEEFTLYYVSTWKRVDDDDDFLNIPTWMEGLYIQLLRAFARGYEEEDDATLSMRIDEIQRGPLWTAAVDRDNEQQWELGPIKGHRPLRIRDPFWNFSSVGDPS